MKKIFTCDKDITGISKKQAIASWDYVIPGTNCASIERFVRWVSKSELAKINQGGEQ